MKPILVSVYTANQQERDDWCAALASSLGDGYDVSVNASSQARYSVLWGPPSSFLEAQPDLRAVFSMAAGVDHLLKLDAIPRDLPIYRLEDAGMGGQMVRYCRHEVEHALLHHQAYRQQQSRCEWLEHPVRDPEAFTVGIFGFGVLGQRVGETLSQEGYQVRAFRRRADAGDHGGIAVFHGPEQWQSFLRNLDALILLAPLTADTRGIIDSDALNALASRAWLINVGRGPLLDDAALIAALNSGRLGGASLDVFSTEPLPPDHTYWQHPQIRITPHIAAVTRILPSAQQIARRIIALDSGRDAGKPVDRDAGY